jgi:uncharacterized lipoprotein YmbA
MRNALIGILFVLVSACTMPETKIYSLNMPHENKAKENAMNASLVIIVDSPRHLSQPYIAYRNSPYQLSQSRYSKWENSPDIIVAHTLRDSLSGIFNDVLVSRHPREGSYSLRVRLRSFERSDEADGPFGALSFDFEFLSPEGKYLSGSTVTKKIKLDDRSFLSLAKGLSLALKESTGEVRKSITGHREAK